MENSSEDEDRNREIAPPSTAQTPGVAAKPPEPKRNLAGFWLLGLFNNFAYVIMLSAAHDLLKANGGSNSTVHAINNASEELANGGNNSWIDFGYESSRDCNPTSTGAILLADILPALLVKAVAPFLSLAVAFKVLATSVLGAASFLLVAEAPDQPLLYLGVVCASLSSGLGEVTFLSYTHRFDPLVISFWSSGTGGAGVLGAGSYAFLTHIGLSPRSTLLLMLSVPVGMLLTFFCLIKPREERTRPQLELEDDLTLESEDEDMERQVYSNAFTEGEDSVTSPLVPSMDVQSSVHESALTFKEKLFLIPGLFKYMVPLGLVYFLEYLINQGLFELLYYPNSSLSHSQQYRWYQLDYQVGVLISRSSLQFIKIRKLFLLAGLQGINVLLLGLMAVYRWPTSDGAGVFLVLALVLWEGMLGGAAYVNTYYRVAQEVDDSRGKREFSLGMTSIADSGSIGVAGLVAIYLHDWICKMPV